MKPTSEYTFPIFISSTHYNLVDLRAELADFLSNLGYRPILSSADGFPDEYPDVQPWESCLRVLNTSFVMILIIDGRYGQELEWQNSGDIFKDKKVSPTHGEYIHAHNSGKRMMVFIRSELMVHYQSFRDLKKKHKDEPDKVKEIMEQVLPAHIDFKTLEFINEVKTTTPIPWIKEFADVTDIKREVQKKMLNELFSLFAVREHHMEFVLNAFNKVMSTLSPEQRKETLQKTGFGKDFVEMSEKLDTKQKELDEVQKQLEEEKETGKTKSAIEAKYKKLVTEKNILEQKINSSSGNHFHVHDGKVYLGTLPSSSAASYFDFVNFNPTTRYSNAAALYPDKCRKCGRTQSIGAFGTLGANPGTILPITLRYCSSCQENKCDDCWRGPLGTVTLNSNSDICYDCRSKPGIVVNPVTKK